MKNNKKVFGASAAAIGVGALLTFNLFIFPNVLAAAPENREIETVTPETAALENQEIGIATSRAVPIEADYEQRGEAGTLLEEPGVPSNINAISMEQAVLAAEEALAHRGIGVVLETADNLSTIDRSFIDAKYAGSTGPASGGPYWYVLFTEREAGYNNLPIDSRYTPDEYLEFLQSSSFPGELRLGVNSKGEPAVIFSYDRTQHLVVEIDALTGGFITMYHDVEDEEFGLDVEDIFYNDDDIRRGLIRPGLIIPGAKG